MFEVIYKLLYSCNWERSMRAQLGTQYASAICERNSERNMRAQYAIASRFPPAQKMIYVVKLKLRIQNFII